MANTWLKKMFRAEVAGVLVALVGLFIALPQFQKDALAELTIHNRYELENKTVFVCDRNSDALSAILPELSNGTKYSLNNFSLRYSFRNLPTDYVVSDEFKSRPGIDKTDFIYDSHTLYAHTSVESPIKSLTIKGYTTISYTIEYTFDGISDKGIITGRVTMTDSEPAKPYYLYTEGKLTYVGVDTSNALAEPQSAETTEKETAEDNSSTSWGKSFFYILIVVGCMTVAFLIFCIKIDGKEIGEIIEDKLPEWLFFIVLFIWMLAIPLLVSIFVIFPLLW